MAEKEKGLTMEKLTFRVQRYEPTRDEKSYLQEFVIPFTKGMTVLDGLNYIKEKIDSTLTFRVSCRMGICGSCGMLINNFPYLACHITVEELGKDVIEIKSLPNYGIIKDLIPDLSPLFENHKAIKPYIVRSDNEEMEEPTAEYLQLPQELDQYLQFSFCLKCGMCVAACPTSATDVLFLGPQSLTQAYRYCADSRDEGVRERTAVVDSGHGLWLCHLAGACSEACPKGVDPALAIQLLKRTVLAQTLRLQKKKEASPIAPPPAEEKPKLPVPEFTAEPS